MQIGDVIYIENLKFHDGQYDHKKFRPCVYLGKNNNNYIYCLPITSNKKRLEHEQAMFLPEQLYSYKKLCFVNVLQVTLAEECQVQLSPYKLMSITVKMLINKIYECQFPTNCYDFYNELKEQIYYESILYFKKTSENQKVKKLKKSNKNR